MQNRNDLDWLAFRYIAGELPEHEAAAFELQLADDQSARDALVQAVELAQLIHAAESPTATPVVRTSRPVALWVSLAAAACVLLLFSLQFPGRDVGTPQVRDSLASAWSEQLGLDVEQELSGLEEDPSDESLADVPGWMVEALRSLHDSGSEGAPVSDEILES